MLNIGFIGCGGIARHHASRLVKLRNARIVAAADAAEAAARSFAADFRTDRDVAICTDHRQLLGLEAVDAVWVCTPTYLHAAPVIAAARAGKHVFCEKPMAMKLGDARRMAEACDRAGVRCTIGFVRRFCPQWGKMKQIVQSGTIGRPAIWRFAAGGKPANPWFRDAAKGGGPLLDGAVHNYDFALQMLGKVDTVQASSTQFDATSVGADTASAILTFAAGDQHTLIWTWGMAAGSPAAHLNDLVGPKGTLQFGMTAPEAPKGFDPKTHGAFTFKGGGGRQRVITYRLRDMFVDQARHVVDCFDKGKQPLVTAADGIAALEVGLAVLKAGQTRHTIKLG
ncbi:MAG: Gfo/Idh/MocA family oxidoreductase [Gemmatimonadota bacterium]